MADFTVGDTVELKSGGPVMTIARISEDKGIQVAFCHWFNGTKPEQGHYPLTSLKHEEEGRPRSR